MKKAKNTSFWSVVNKVADGDTQRKGNIEREEREMERERKRRSCRKMKGRTGLDGIVYGW